jgi:hypothetical protein
VSTQAPPTPHAGHDLLLVASVVDRNPTAADRLAAERQIAGCPSCAELAADLRAIALATAALPAVERTRDFTLRPEDAARLQPGGWRRIAAAFGAARLEVLRPLGAGLATLGLAGLLLATLPAIQLPIGSSGSASGQAPRDAASDYSASGGVPAAAAAPSAAASSGPVGISGDGGAPPTAAVRGPYASGAPPVFGTERSPELAAGPIASAAPSDAGKQASGPLAQGEPTPPGSPSPLFAVSVALILAGVAMFGLSRAAARGATR